MMEHPSEETVLLLAAGRLDRAPGLQVTTHVRNCAACGEILGAATLLVDAAVAHGVAAVPGPASTASDVVPRHAAIVAAHGAARRLVRESDPATWLESLAREPLRNDEAFLIAAADEVIPRAAAQPDEALALAAALEAHGRAATWSGAGPAGDFAVLLALARSVAYRLRSDSVRSLEVLRAAEAQIVDGHLSLEVPRLHLAMATASFMLERIDEAKALCASARQGFWRTGQENRIAKCRWMEAHIAWREGDLRGMYRRAHEAFRSLRTNDDPESATALVLVTIAAALLRRTRLARKLLGVLEDEPYLHENRYEQARLGWVRGVIAMADGDLAEAYVCFDRASEAFASLGVPYNAARYKLDAAHVAGLLGDLARQRHAATLALSILSTLPGHRTDAQAAASELRAALAASAGLGHAIDRALMKLGPA